MQMNDACARACFVRRHHSNVILLAQMHFINACTQYVHVLFKLTDYFTALLDKSRSLTQYQDVVT